MPEKAIARGYGVCSQQSRIVYYILQRQGLEAKIRTHPNHTLVTTPQGIIDPVYGVFIPHSLEEMRRNPSLVNSYYTLSLAWIRSIYGEESAKWDKLDSMKHDKMFAYMLRVEKIAEFLKLLLPLFLIILGLCIVKFARTESKRNLS